MKQIKLKNGDNKNDLNGVDKLEIIKDTGESIDQEYEIDEMPYFGYDISKKDPSLFQSTSYGIVDPAYLIGSGDEIIIMIWGETQFRQVLTVDREGFVFIPKLGFL